MKRRLLALIIYPIFWLLFFAFARVLFILFQFKEASDYSLASLVLTFFHGFKLDLSATGYFMLLPLLVYAVHVFTGGKWFSVFLKAYSILIIIISSLIVTGDAAVYRYWAYRLEFSVLEYLKTPGDAMASARIGEMILVVIVFSATVTLFTWIYLMLHRRFFIFIEKPKNRIITALISLTATGSLILPIRGGTGVAPLNTGAVYFSDKLFPNHAAINEVWNFGHTAAYAKPVKNPYIFMQADEALEILKLQSTDTSSTIKVLKNGQPNIILIILESFGSYVADPVDRDSLPAPEFAGIASSGLYWKNFYAAGSRTDKAIPAILSGQPNLPTIQILRDSKKTQSLPSIVSQLEERGYNPSFWYGGDINFANLKSYLLTSGFDRLISKDDFGPENFNSKWGVHDHILFDSVTASLPKLKSPFFVTVLTLSSHEPFEVPMEPWFKGKDELSRFKNSVRYADMALGRFIDSLRNTELWSNTLVILMADHCRRYSEKVEVYSDEIYRIPMVWTGGTLLVKDSVITTPGSQFDFPATLLGQSGGGTGFIFGKNLLSKGSKKNAFYTYNEGFSFITDSSRVIYDIKLGQALVREGKSPQSAEMNGKAILQILFDDYLKR